MRKLLILFLYALVITASTNVSANPIGIESVSNVHFESDGGGSSSRNFAIETGFSLDQNIYTQRNFPVNRIGRVYEPVENKMIGSFHVVAASFDTIGYNQYKAVAYKVDMYPQEQSWSCGLFGWSTCRAQGQSHQIDLKSVTAGTMLQRSPLTQPNTESYNVGVGISGNKLGLSASVNLSRSHLNIRGLHPDSRTFHARYEYKTLFWNNDYLYDYSFQYGAFSFSQQNYSSIRLDTEVQFFVHYSNSNHFTIRNHSVSRTLF